MKEEMSIVFTQHPSLGIQKSYLNSNLNLSLMMKSEEAETIPLYWSSVFKLFFSKLKP